MKIILCTLIALSIANNSSFAKQEALTDIMHHTARQLREVRYTLRTHTTFGENPLEDHEVLDSIERLKLIINDFDKIIAEYDTTYRPEKAPEGEAGVKFLKSWRATNVRYLRMLKYFKTLWENLLDIDVMERDLSEINNYSMDLSYLSNRGHHRF